jgi:glycosyltransferase involved in cell wall biosynthesis
MRIAVYYPWVYLTSGAERTILETCRRSHHDYTIFTNRYEPQNTYPEFRDLHVVTLSTIPVRRQLAPVLSAAVKLVSQKLPLAGYDALIVHCDGLGNLVLNRSRDVPAVCFCHTPLRPVYDPEYRRRALGKLSGLGRLAFYALSAGFACADRRLFQRYKRVLFNSHETLARAERGGLLQGMTGRYEVLHPGVDWHSYQPTWQYENYFLVAGRIMWTKNIELAIEAFTRFKAQSPSHDRFKLIVAGRVDKKSEVYLERLRGMVKERCDVEFVVSPSDDVMHRLYSDCYAVLFPAFNEDWGLVPLEANAFGKAVIASDRGGPRESQLHGETAFLVPCDAGSFSNTMAMMASNPELIRSMGRRARVASLAYDWAQFVERFDEILDCIGEEAAAYGAPYRQLPSKRLSAAAD